MHIKYTYIVIKSGFIASYLLYIGENHLLNNLARPLTAT